MGAGGLHGLWFDSRAAVGLNVCLYLFSGQPPDASLSDTSERTTFRTNVSAIFSTVLVTRLRRDTHFNGSPVIIDSFVAFFRIIVMPPSSNPDFLLHYNYGAAAMKYWGKNYAALIPPGILRPQAHATGCWRSYNKNC